MDERKNFKPLVFIDREGKPGGGKGLLISKDLSFTLSGLRQHLLVYEGREESDGDGVPASLHGAFGESICLEGSLPHIVGQREQQQTGDCV